MDIFSGAAMERIMAGIVAYEEHAAPGQMRPVRVAGHGVYERFSGTLPRGYPPHPTTFDPQRTLNMGKVGYGGMTASAEDWSSFGYGLVNFCCPSVNIHAYHLEKLQAWKDGGKAGPEPTPDFVGDVALDAAPGGPLEHKPVGDGGILAGATCLAINPSCKVIDEGTAVITGIEVAGNFVVIFEMCPCGDYDGYTGST
tara:strand:+ start:2555 stop:3148 length:594 start_codon:yes stop_codon:yes gene_type:complete